MPQPDFQTLIQSAKRIFILGAAALILILAMTPHRAQAQEAPLLRVYDLRMAPNAALPPADTYLSASMDFAALQDLPQETLETSTIWTDGVQLFEGVSLRVLLEPLALDGGQLILIAQNDYQVRLSVEDALTQEGLLAHSRNGQRMSLRDKGPLWLVYPYDKSAVYRSETIFAQSVWQLDRIVILP
ncbi:oxidoreductase [Litorivita sp. NS0012-18]|uniref:oxidoreductase n=1 Tax=Litorivita sp. NS0012-18 TaxID=3127655 RepID=UPI0031086FE8